MKTAPVILSIAAGGSLSVHLIPRVREIVMNSDLGNLVVGEGAQCSLGHGLDGLFRKTAEEVLATKPDWPETGFRGVVRDQLDKAHNPIMAYLDYEPYGDDEATRKYRFDAGNRPRTNAEMDLVIRCIGQIQSESYERGIKLEVGVWNTPITIDKSVDWPSINAMHDLADLDFIFLNEYRPLPSATQRKITARDVRTIRKNTKQPITVTVHANGGRDFIPRNEASVRKKGRAIRDARARCLFWVNTAWLLDQANESPFEVACNQWAKALGYRRTRILPWRLIR